MERPYLILFLRNTYRGNIDFMSVSRVISSTRRKKHSESGGGGGGYCYVYVVFDLPLVT